MMSEHNCEVRGRGNPRILK